MTPEQKEHALTLLQSGEKLEAARYFQKTLGVDAEKALLLAEKLEKEEVNTELLQRFKGMRSKMGSGPGTQLPRTVGLIFMSSGLIMLTVIIYLDFANYQFSKRAVPVTGKVISYDSHYSGNHDGGGSTLYTPTFEYSFHGTKHTYQSNTSSSSRDYEIGESVEILVDPDDPGNILVNTFWERWLLSIILGFMGVMFTGLGYMAYRVFGKNS